MYGAGLSEPNLNYYITTRLLLNLADRNKYTFSLEEAKLIIIVTILPRGKYIVLKECHAPTP